MKNQIGGKCHWIKHNKKAPNFGRLSREINGGRPDGTASLENTNFQVWAPYRRGGGKRKRKQDVEEKRRRTQGEKINEKRKQNAEEKRRRKQEDGDKIEL